MKKTQVTLLLFLLSTWSGVYAQNTPASATPATTQVTLGNATVPLTGPWKFHIGDNMAWAQPDYDDSAWGTMDLTPTSVDPNNGTSGFVPGWTARGYPGYSGYAWYRLRVNIQSGQSALALKMPDEFDDAYQVYVNGRLIGQFGRFTAHGVTYYLNQPRAYSLPANLPAGQAMIAIRMWMATSTALQQQGTGGLHGPPILGQNSVVRALMGMYWYRLDHIESSVSLSIAVNLLALLIAFGLFWLDRSELAYLWLGLQCMQGMLYAMLVLAGNYTAWVSGSAVNLFLTAVLSPLGNGLEVLFWAYWFRTARMGRLHRAVWSIVALLGIAMAMMQAPLYGSVVPVHANIWLRPLTGVFEALLALLLLWVTYRGIRKDLVEGLLALPAVLLVVISWYGGQALAALHVPTYFYFFGVIFPLGLVAGYVSLAIITVLMLRRFLHGQRERAQWKLEIEQARQVQQMLIPEALPIIPGFALESEYRPAQQVGGDFFQIIGGEDNSILIVLGDVSGKGLKAAMLVSLIVGTIRTLAKFTRDPMEILRGLNERLCGRMQGHFATCLVVYIAGNGEATVANAGHLAPYWNGEEIAIAGSLPLGIVEAAEFEQTRLMLQPGDRLTMMTDGVVEAQNEERELFGFQRTQAASNQTAVEIAATAQAFGQQDDITVLRITRSAMNLEFVSNPTQSETGLGWGTQSVPRTV